MKEGAKGFEAVNNDVIELPQDQELVEKLKRKYVEYEARKLEWEKENPLEDQRGRSHEIYKYAILGRLLEEGKVDRVQIIKDLTEVHGGIYIEEFDDAFRVISKYANGDADRLSGGTGLK